eukprot:scaffold17391_cov54-Attheya_sp.AAC.4
MAEPKMSDGEADASASVVKEEGDNETVEDMEVDDSLTAEDVTSGGDSEVATSVVLNSDATGRISTAGSATGETTEEEDADEEDTTRDSRKIPLAAVTTTFKKTSVTSHRSSKKRARSQVSSTATTSAAGGGVTVRGVSPVPAVAAAPTLEQVKLAATKAVQDNPPYVHLSSRDGAPQLKLDGTSDRLTVRGAMRGYRMARATHGVSQGNYFYEVLVLSPSGSTRDAIASLPPNVRLAKHLQTQLQDQLVQEELQIKKEGMNDDDKSAATTSSSETNGVTNLIGGHLRMGWSMRTGDLQAPVGYDRWSYAIRDIMGSRIHNSRREDQWGGVPFGVGDVVGFAVALVNPSDKRVETDDVGGTNSNVAISGGPIGASDTTTSNNNTNANPSTGTNKRGGGYQTMSNHIRFFKNGEGMGQFVEIRGIRSGGEAFDTIQDGTYYPAVSSYMRACVRVNFGPYFVHPPKRLPSGMKLKPVSELCPPPPTPQEAVAKALKEQPFSKKTEEATVTAFRDAVHAEAQIRFDAYNEHMAQHVELIREARQARHLSTSDLPPPPTKITTDTNDDEQLNVPGDDIDKGKS